MIVLTKAPKHKEIIGDLYNYVVCCAVYTPMV